MILKSMKSSESKKSVVQTIGKKNRAAPHRLFNLKFWNLEVRTWKLELGI